MTFLEASGRGGCECSGGGLGSPESHQAFGGAVSRGSGRPLGRAGAGDSIALGLVWGAVINLGDLPLGSMYSARSELCDVQSIQQRQQSACGCRVGIPGRGHGRASASEDRALPDEADAARENSKQRRREGVFSHIRSEKITLRLSCVLMAVGVS